MNNITILTCKYIAYAVHFIIQIFYTCYIFTGMTSTFCISAKKECPADILLIIDHSLSMSGYFTKVLNFVKKFVSSFELSDTTTRVGVVVFNNTVSIEVSY